MPRAVRRRRGAERGFVLVAVLWLSVALAMAASGFLSDVRRESYRLRAEIGTAEAVELARSGLHVALADLGREDAARAISSDGTLRPVAMPGGEVRLRILDENGKVDLNHAQPAFLARVLGNLGGGGRDAFDEAGLADRLIATARRAREDRTAPSLGEILRASGLDDDLAARAGRVLTIHAYSARINPLTAPWEVLTAVPLLSADDVADILDARRQGADLPPLRSAQGWFRFTEGPVYTIEATGRSEAGFTATVVAMVVGEGRSFRSGRKRYRVIEARILR